MPNPISVPLSGNVEIDSLTTGYKWDASSLSFSFPDSGLWYVEEQFFDLLTPAQLAEYALLSFIYGPLGAIEHLASTAVVGTVALNGFQQFNEQQQISARFALQQFAAVSGLTFTESSEGLFNHATIRYAETANTGAAAAFGVPPLPRVELLIGNGVLGDAWFNSDGRFDEPKLGNYAGYTMLHETGHALGLKHAHESGLFGGTVPSWLEDVLTDVNGPVLPAEKDSLEFSVMTYRSMVNGDLSTPNEPNGYPQSLMMLDIQAIQYLYGANFSTNADNTTYRWDPSTGEMFINGAGQGAPAENRVFLTIWDGDGTDTYDLSNYLSDVTIDLRPGGWTTTSMGQLADLNGSISGGLARGNVANALLYNGDTRSLIENGIGGSGNDQITGNVTGNQLEGGAGNDTLDGSIGNDNLIGGIGNDSLIGSGGSDTIVAGEGADFLQDSSAFSGPDDIGFDLLVGGLDGQVDRFGFINSNEADIISGFEDGLDQIDLLGYQITDVSAFDADKNGVLGESVDYMRFENGNLLLDLGAAEGGAPGVNTVTILNQSALLTNADFTFLILN